MDLAQLFGGALGSAMGEPTAVRASREREREPREKERPHGLNMAMGGSQ